MPSEGPLSPGTLASDNSYGAVAWTNPGNAASSDNSYATASPSPANDTEYLKATNFGFAIPAGSTINGIVAEIEQSQTGSDVKDVRVRIVKGGVVGATDKSNAAAWPLIDAYQTYGSSSDLWGESWSPADINASNFGVVIAAQNPGLVSTAQVDHIRMTVYYTPGGRVGGNNVACAPETANRVWGGTAFYSHGPVVAESPAHVVVCHPQNPAVESGRSLASHGFAPSIPILAGPPVVVRETDPPAAFPGTLIAVRGVKEPDSPGFQSRLVAEPQAPALFHRVYERHGAKEPEEPAHSQIVRGPDSPPAGNVIVSHGFQEAVVWPGRPAIARAPDTPSDGRVFSWQKYADPWSPTVPAIVRGSDLMPFAGSITQSRIPELGPRHPGPGIVVRGESPLDDGSAFVWRQILVHPGVPPIIQPAFVWIFDPPAETGRVVRARGFAAATASTSTTLATAPYRLVAGQIFTPGAVAGQTGGQG